MSQHIPSHHPDFPGEKGKPLSERNKVLMVSVRRAVLALLDGEEHLTLPQRVVVSLPRLDLQRKPHETRHITKQLGKDIAIALDIDRKKVLTRVSRMLEGQYKHMSDERLLHRYENHKILRDTRYLLGIIHLTAGYGPLALASDIKLATKAHGKNTGIYQKSEAHAALFTLMHQAQKFLKKSQYKQFLEECYQMIPGVLAQKSGL